MASSSVSPIQADGAGRDFKAYEAIALAGATIVAVSTAINGYSACRRPSLTRKIMILDRPTSVS
jgi:hypothetical protein